MDISFDPAKRAANMAKRGLDMAKHGLDMADAGEVFDGRHATRADDRFDCGEDRSITIGHLAGRCAVVVWPPRDGTRRIISMRYAHVSEERRFLG